MRGTSTLFRKQIGMMIKVAVGLSAFAVILAGIGARDVHAEDAKHLRILFTHDIHSYVDESEGMEQGKLREHGDFAALKTLIDEYKDDFFTKSGVHKYGNGRTQIRFQKE